MVSEGVVPGVVVPGVVVSGVVPGLIVPGVVVSGVAPGVVVSGVVPGVVVSGVVPGLIVPGVVVSGDAVPGDVPPAPSPGLVVEPGEDCARSPFCREASISAGREADSAFSAAATVEAFPGNGAFTDVRG